MKPVKIILCIALVTLMMLMGTACDVLLALPANPDGVTAETLMPNTDPTQTNAEEITDQQEAPEEEITDQGGTPNEETAEAETSACAHVYEEWVIDQEPALGVEGVKHTTCTVCGALYEETIEMLYSQGLDIISNQNGTCRVNSIGTCTDTTIVIPPTYNGDRVTYIWGFAFRNCTELTSVIIPDSVTGIGNEAFRGCTALTFVDIPDGIQSIGFSMFEGCVNLIEKENGIHYVDGWVVGCDSMTKEAVVRENTVGIANSSFYSCPYLTSIVIPASVTRLSESALAHCLNLTSITVAEGNPVYYSDGNCIIEKANKTLVAGCKTSVIPQDGSVAHIGEYAFQECTELTSIVIPDGVTSIDQYAFYDCAGITSVIIPDSVAGIDQYAFCRCQRLTDIYFTGTESEWNAISKGSAWDDGTGSYTVHYNYVP